MPHPHNMTDYDKAFALFKNTVPEYYNFAGDVIDKWAADPKKLAMLWVDDTGATVRKTFLDLARTSRKLANGLTASGVKKNDVMLVILPRNYEWWEIMTTGIRMGTILAPGTTQLTASDLAFRANKSQATCIITTGPLADAFDAVADQCPTVKCKIVISTPRKGWLFYDDLLASGPEEFATARTRSEDSCLVYFTSGTVGLPKMALHTHASYPIGHRATGRYWLDLTPEDMHWNISDTGWAKAAWSSYFGPWNCGAALFVHHTDSFDPVAALDLLQQYPITTFCGTPTIYRMLVRQNLSHYRFSTLRHCVSAGEPLTAEIVDLWKKATGTIIHNGYGQTETVLLAASFPCMTPRFGSMGKPSPGIDLNVIDENGDVLPPDTEGEIAIRVKPHRPIGLFKEYWKETNQTASVFRGDWYLTGDRAFVDKDGYFWFTGRSDDIILTSGYRIDPLEIESALIEHPAVFESAVVSSPGETRGEIIKAFVVLAPGYTPSEAVIKALQGHVKKVTAPYKYPRKIAFVESLPKTVSGKIRRRELRNAEWGHP